MKTIKFRGRDIETGKFIYGDLIHSHSEKGGVLISEERPISTPARWVDPDSVALFLAYDKNGKEVYSDDMIYLCKIGAYCYAEDFFKIEDIGKTIEDIGKTFDNIELVEKN